MKRIARKRHRRNVALDIKKETLSNISTNPRKGDEPPRSPSSPWRIPALIRLLIWFLSAGCQGESPEPMGPAEVFVLTSDYVTGGYALVDADRAVGAGADLVHSDAIVRQAEGKLFVINRMGGDNIQVIDPKQEFTTIAQFSTGDGSNPQDVAVESDDRAFVALYETDYLLIVDPSAKSSQEFELGRIDLSEYGDADLPEVSSVLLVDGLLYATLQRLTRTSEGFLAENDSYLLQIDPESGEVLDHLTLVYPNPFGIMRLGSDGRSVLLAEAGVFTMPDDEEGSWDGGIEKIDLEAFLSMGVIASELELEGDVLNAIEDEQGQVYAIVGRPSADGQDSVVVSASAQEESTVISDIYRPGGWVVGDIAFGPEGMLWVADQSVERPGIFIYDPDAAGEADFIPFDDVLPPSQIELLN